METEACLDLLVSGRAGVEASCLLLAAATHTPSVGFSSYQLYLDGRFLGHHGLGWGLGEPSGQPGGDVPALVELLKGMQA